MVIGSVPDRLARKHAPGAGRRFLSSGRVGVFIFVWLCCAAAAPPVLCPRLCAENPYHITSHQAHEIRILSDGPAALAARLEMIERAQRSIDVEYFVLRSDRAGRLFAQALARQAEKGVKVRVLLDAHKSQAEVGKLLAHEFKAHQIELHYYNTSIFPVSWVLHRNHRKFVIVDRNECVMGGRNLGERNFGLNPQFNTLDRDVWIRGPIVASIAETFDQFWASKFSVPAAPPQPPLPPDAPSALRPERGAVMLRQARLDAAARDAEFVRRQERARDFFRPTAEDRELGAALRTGAEGGMDLGPIFTAHSVTFVSDKPFDHEHSHQVAREIYRRIADARSAICLESPVFLLLHGQKKVFRDLLESGVDVEIFTNGPESTTKKLVRLLASYDMKYLVRHGARVSLFCPKSISRKDLLSQSAKNAVWEGHSKSYVIDAESSMIGTYNFEPYSNTINTEAVLFFDGSPEIAGALQAHIDAQLVHARGRGGVELSDHACPALDSARVDSWTQLLSVPAVFFKHLL